MHTVCETHAFVKAAAAAGMSASEIEALVTFLAANPMAGDVIKGTGGCRKVRLAGRGKGKSGGYRTITFYSGVDVPVFLLTVFSKGERVDLTQDERNTLEVMTKLLVQEYQRKVTKVSATR